MRGFREGMAAGAAVILAMLSACAGRPDEVHTVKTSAAAAVTSATSAGTGTGTGAVGMGSSSNAMTAVTRHGRTAAARTSARTSAVGRPPTRTPATVTAGVIQPVKPDSGALTDHRPLTDSGHIRRVACRTAAPKALELVEFELTIGGIGDSVNVYDPAQVSLDMALTSSTGRTLAVPGFYYVPYPVGEDKRVGNTPAGDPTWRFRFTPLNEGTWDFTITLTQDGKRADSVAGYINVAAATDRRGFLGVEPVNRRVFAFQDGTPFLPLGENIGWAMGDTYRYFDGILRKLGRNDANYVRMWLASWSLSLITRERAPDDLSGGMRRAVMVDGILQTMAEEDIYTSFVIYHHGMFSKDRANPDWHNSPFNEANPHGYLRDPAAFFRDERAKRDAKLYLRYLVARYGYSRHIMTWELFNEIDGTNGEPVEALNWHREMTAYLRSIDPYSHMVTTSAARWGDPIPRDKGFDFIYLHRYNYGALKNLVDLQRTLSDQFDRPILIGEVGVDVRGFSPVDRQMISVHQQNWAGLMGGGGGAAINWYWEQMDAAGDYGDFRPAAAFARRIPWADPGLTDFDTRDAAVSDTQAEVIGYRGPRYAFAWLYDTRFTHTSRRRTTFSAFRLSVPLADGTYRVEWIDPWSGSTVRTQTLSAAGGRLPLQAPDWERDLAVAVTAAGH